jgi:hypothetical protein
MDLTDAHKRFDVRRIVFAPGAERRYHESEWRDVIVVVESGWLELECDSGSSRHFGSGAVLWLIDLPLRVLRNVGTAPTVLVALSRPRTARSGGFDSGGMTRA